MLVRRSLSSSLTVIAICLVTGLLGYALMGTGGLKQVSIYLVFGLFAMSVDFLWGYSGLLSFGQAVFFGLGAFGYSWVRLGILGTIADPTWASFAGLVVSILAPTLLAAAIGYFLFYGDITGPNFTVVTLALSFLMSSLALGWNTLFGGYTGFPYVNALSIELGSVALSAAEAIPRFVLVTLLCALGGFTLRMLLELPFGLVLDGLRDSEERLEYLGIDVAQAKVLVWGVSAAFGGLAGGVYASISQYASYELLGVLLSTEAVVWVAVGGRGALGGAFLGAVVVRVTSYFLSGIAVNYWLLFLGFLFIAVVLGGTNGIIGFWRSVIARWFGDAGNKGVR